MCTVIFCLFTIQQIQIKFLKLHNQLFLLCVCISYTLSYQSQSPLFYIQYMSQQICVHIHYIQCSCGIFLLCDCRVLLWRNVTVDAVFHLIFSLRIDDSASIINTKYYTLVHEFSCAITAEWFYIIYTVFFQNSQQQDTLKVRAKMWCMPAVYTVQYSAHVGLQCCVCLYLMVHVRRVPDASTLSKSNMYGALQCRHIACLSNSFTVSPQELQSACIMSDIRAYVRQPWSLNCSFNDLL